MLPQTKPEAPKDAKATSQPPLATSPTAGTSLHDRVMADAHIQAAKGAFSPKP